MPEQHPMRGIVLMSASLLLFSCLDAITKHLLQTYSVPLVIWARYTVHWLLMLFILGPSMGLRLLDARRPGLMLLRSLCLLATSGCGVAAFSQMPLAETSAIIYIAPVMVALLAGPMLGEKVHRHHWLAMGIGFCGMLLIAHPGGQVTPTGILLAVGAAAFFSLYQILTRKLSLTENLWALVFHPALTGSLLMSLSLPLIWPDTLPPWPDLLQLGAIGGIAVLGYAVQTRAFRHAPVSQLVPLGYSQLIWSTLLGWLVFNHLPDGPAIIGIALIAVGGLVVIRSQRTKA
ncbi:DMT family transporter [Denitratisoma oestradiolicum]|uniref:Permease n=1 Tax=Denitratisoma oestradiolicum TaxID=311182 RepID=A0A6S6YAA6_9PROT|nr:DMT family transporter [Denitratisoma oestradiolicum]CAB1369532.1 Permease [Denitratisoma oestradiolicum]